jgi:hypothetical protein
MQTLLTYNRKPNSSRTLNYVGKSNTPADGYSASLVDDLKFYSIALNVTQIHDEFVLSGSYQSEPSTKPFLTNYWPINDLLFCDLMNGKQMILSSSVTLTYDRYG